MVHNKVPSSLFCLMGNSQSREAKIVKSRCRLDLRRHFFSQRVIDTWNRLDQSVVESKDHQRIQVRSQ